MSSHIAQATDSQARFLAFAAEKRALIEKTLQQAYEKQFSSVATQTHTDLAQYLYHPIERFTCAGGKRIRPLLCLLGAQAYGDNEQDALVVGCAIEHFQTAALIHDDIADESDLRRGEPCVHITHGIGPAVNCGDLELAYVFGILENLENVNDATRLAIYQGLFDMTHKTIQGQALDLGWARDQRWDITPDDYFYMAAHKTAYYSCAYPLVLGGLCANASIEQLEPLWQFGILCGLAFQIQDDLLNLIGDKEAQGKDFMSDITEGKRTLVVIHALQTLRESNNTAQEKELLDILSAHTHDMRRLCDAVEILKQTQSIAFASQCKEKCLARSIEILQNASIQPDAYAILISMTHYLMDRKA